MPCVQDARLCAYNSTVHWLEPGQHFTLLARLVLLRCVGYLIFLLPLGIHSGSPSVNMHASKACFVLLFFWLFTYGISTTKQHPTLTANSTGISNATNGANPEYAMFSAPLVAKYRDLERLACLTHPQGLLDPRRQAPSYHRLLPSLSWPSDPYRPTICLHVCNREPCQTMSLQVTLRGYWEP